MEYKIIESDTLAMLVTQVNGAIKEGFIPLGGVSSNVNFSIIMYAQAMTRIN